MMYVKKRLFSLLVLYFPFGGCFSSSLALPHDPQLYCGSPVTLLMITAPTDCVVGTGWLLELGLLEGKAQFCHDFPVCP